MKSLPCNVVIQPNERLANTATETSERLAGYGSRFTLKNGEFFPHASVYMLQLRMEDLETIKERLQNIARAAMMVHLQADGYGYSMQYLDASYQKPTELGQLQQDVIAALNPLRDGMREKDVARMEQAEGLALENFRLYGWNSIGKLYRPHLTLTRFLEGQNIDDLALPDISTFTGDFDRLGIFEMGDNGTCIRSIAEWGLGDW